MKRTTIILAVIEAAVLLVMKACDWKESRTQKPASSKVRQAGGRRVVNPSPPAYDGESPEGEISAINILASSSTADEKIHEEE